VHVLWLVGHRKSVCLRTRAPRLTCNSIPQPQMDLPIALDPTPISASSQLHKFDEQWNAIEVTGSCDTTWASDRTERRSMGGIVMILAVAAVYYHTRL
jgi:hypothetical protein